MRIANDSETLTVSTTAIPLTANKLAGNIDTVDIFVEGAIRFWTSGKAPTSTDGIPLFNGSSITLPANEAQAFRAIRNGGSDAKIHVQYFRSLQ